jgi:hypothetical protein
MPAGRAGGTPTRNRSARRRDHSMFARFVRAAAKLRPAQHFRWCNDGRTLRGSAEIPASFRRSPEPQFRHDLSLMTPSGIERLSDNRDHPLCLSQGRSTRSCSGAPQKHPSPADARSKIEGVALPPIDAFTRRAERRGPTPSPGPAAPPNFFVPGDAPFCHPGRGAGAHMWTAPDPQGDFAAMCRSGRLRSYVRPVDAVGWTAGPDGIRGSGPKHAKWPRLCHWVPRVLPILGSSDRHLAVPLQVPTSPGPAARFSRRDRPDR